MDLWKLVRRYHQSHGGGKKEVFSKKEARTIAPHVASVIEENQDRIPFGEPGMVLVHGVHKTYYVKVTRNLSSDTVELPRGVDGGYERSSRPPYNVRVEDIVDLEPSH